VIEGSTFGTEFKPMFKKNLFILKVVSITKHSFYLIVFFVKDVHIPLIVEAFGHS